MRDKSIRDNFFLNFFSLLNRFLIPHSFKYLIIKKEKEEQNNLFAQKFANNRKKI